MQKTRKSQALLGLLATTMLASAACTSTQTTLQTVISMPQAKLDLVSYIESGRYAEEVAAIVTKAKIGLIRSLKGVERPASRGRLGPQSVEPVLSGFLVSAALFVGVSLMTAPPPKGALEPYFDA